MFWVGFSGVLYIVGTVYWSVGRDRCHQCCELGFRFRLRSWEHDDRSWFGEFLDYSV